MSLIIQFRFCSPQKFYILLFSNNAWPYCISRCPISRTPQLHGACNGQFLPSPGSLCVHPGVVHTCYARVVEPKLPDPNVPRFLQQHVRGIVVDEHLMRLARSRRAGPVAFSGESGCGHDVSGRTRCGCGTFHMPPATNFRVTAAENWTTPNNLSSTFSQNTAWALRIRSNLDNKFSGRATPFTTEPPRRRFDSDSIATPATHSCDVTEKRSIETTSRRQIRKYTLRIFVSEVRRREHTPSP